MTGVDQNIVSKETAYKCTFGKNADVCCFNCQKYINPSMPGKATFIILNQLHFHLHMLK